MSATRLILRYHWLAFAALILLGAAGELFFPSYSQLGIGARWRLHAWHYTVVGGHAALFGLLGAATYADRRLLWSLAINIICIKLYRLLKFYALVDYPSWSNIYNDAYWTFFYQSTHWKIRWLAVPGELLFGNNSISAAFLTTLYAYWLVGCYRLLCNAPRQNALL